MYATQQQPHCLCTIRCAISYKLVFIGTAAVLRNAAKKQNFAHVSKVVEQLKYKSREPIPLVELHMFPQDPLQLNSTWLVLIVPKSEKLFGEMLYLCRPEGQKSQCVAELPFEHAPVRLLRGWDWALDPMRTIPHGKLLCWEVVLATSVSLAVCLALYIVVKLLLSWRRKDDVNVEEAMVRLELKSYKLTTHAKVHAELGDGETGTIVDAGHEVSVLEVQCSDKIIGSTLERLLGYAKSCFSKPQRVWGRLEELQGWYQDVPCLAAIDINFESHMLCHYVSLS